MIDVFNGRRRNASGQSSLSYVQISHELKQHLKLFTGSSWVVFTYLSLHADQDGRCWPSISLIAEETGLTDKTIHTAIKHLCTVKIDGKSVLSIEPRYSESGRQTSNLYTVFPEGEGVKFTTGEGGKIYHPHYIEEDTERSIPCSPQRKPRKQTQLPKDDDPALDLYVTYRMALGMDPEFTVGEWQGVHICLRQMIRHGVTAEDIAMRTRALAKKWGKPHMVTLHALWKHWGSAIPQQDTGERAAMILDFVQKLG